MRARSLKAQRIYRERRKVVAQQLAAFPICQRCSNAPAVDVHELLSRARGGSILDESNLATLCRECHDWVTTHPAQATAEGWLRSAGVHEFVSSDGWYCDTCRLPRLNQRHRSGAA